MSPVTPRLRPPQSGWIEVITGGMFSGKSEELIRRLRRAKIAKQNVQAFKPAIDDRFSANEIVSHDARNTTRGAYGFSLAVHATRGRCIGWLCCLRCVGVL